MKKSIFIVVLITCLVFVFSFQKKEVKTQKELMDEYIEGHISKVRKEEWKKCFSNTIKDAEQYVDSIIYRKVNFNITDSLKTPGKPFKPSRPFDSLELDTTPVKPILVKEKVEN